MTAKTASPVSADRDSLRKAYLYVVNNWAVDASEVAEHLGVENSDATSVLKRLQSKGLVVGDRVNDERKLTWQSFYDIQNSDVKETRKSARADFDAAFPKGAPINVPNRLGQPGATGPRYTDAQIKKGLAARKQGKKNAEVAEIAGVKSPSYFSKTLKRIEQENAAKPKARKTPAKKGSRKVKTTAK
jgi:hypothetical protein